MAPEVRSLLIFEFQTAEVPLKPSLSAVVAGSSLCARRDPTKIARRGSGPLALPATLARSVFVRSSSAAYAIVQTPSAAATSPAAAHASASPSASNTTTTTPPSSSNARSSSEKENSAKRKKPSKTYLDMVMEAITALKDHSGSSSIAITKWIKDQYPDTDTPHFRNRISIAFKSGVTQQKLVKNKNSYKISAEFKRKQRGKRTSSVQHETTKAKHQKQLAALAQTMSPEELLNEKKKLAALEATERRQQAAALKAKQLADRIRRRRFPMEDTKLHAEDKELSVRPPSDVTARPYLPYFWHFTKRNAERTGKTSSQILQYSKVDGLDCGNHGLVVDLLQVYHFYRGDVHFETELIPQFTLQHLVYATEQIMSGHAKAQRCVPPLLVHLFCTTLQLLLDLPSGKSALRDLKKLAPVVTPASWADICSLYMDAMQRYATTDASRDPNVLPSLNIDVQYLLGITDQALVPMTPFVGKQQGEATVQPLPDGYVGYLGDERGVLHRAYQKLSRQDPWLLTAEELMALLRALTDDLLGNHPVVQHDMDAREEEMQELSRTKRAADAHYRKVRLAFEGPRKGARKAEESTEASENGKVDKKTEDDAFQPTATKKQFELAKRAQQKANDAYENGIQKLVARTEPVGYDRNHNAVYCFRHDPEVLYVEDLRGPSTLASHLPKDFQFERRSWHIIDSTSLFDLFTSSLDIRGRREHDLYEELVGPAGAQQSLRRFLYDDVQASEDAANREKEKESLKRRFEVARSKCDEEQGRRSGRLSGHAVEELAEVKNEIQSLHHQRHEHLAENPDYQELTGLKLVQKFDSASRKRETRRTREHKTSAAETNSLRPVQTSKLVSTGNLDGTGLVGMIVADLLELEERCEALSPWEGVDRAGWIAQLEGAVQAWNHVSPPQGYAPPGTPTNWFVDGSLRQAKRESLDSAASATKRRKFDSPPSSSANFGASSMPSILTMLRQPLLDLEERLADISNLAVAAKDNDLADENMSTDGTDDDRATKERLEKAWKKIIYRIRPIPARGHVQIRDAVVAGIAAARKAHLADVVSELRSALLLHHPGSAGACKAAAIKVLEDHGDYDPVEDEDDESDDEDEGKDEIEEELVPSVISMEGAIVRSSLGGSPAASRDDWIEAVKSVKTFSRLASLASGFVLDSMRRIERMEFQHDDLVTAMAKWEKDQERRAKNNLNGRKTGKAKAYDGPSEVWANVRITDEICMAKAENYPWWPATKCEAKDSALAQSISELDRCLVSLVGESGELRVVMNSDIREFTGQTIDDEDTAKASKDTRNQLDECMTLARRILRGRQRAAT